MPFRAWSLGSEAPAKPLSESVSQANNVWRVTWSDMFLLQPQELCQDPHALFSVCPGNVACRDTKPRTSQPFIGWNRNHKPNYSSQTCFLEKVFVFSFFTMISESVAKWACSTQKGYGPFSEAKPQKAEFFLNVTHKKGLSACLAFSLWILQKLLF